MLQVKKGYSLLEIIGILSVIGILAGVVAPKVFNSIVTAKTAKVVSDLHVYHIATNRWYKDIGTLNRVDSNCNVVSFTESFDFGAYLSGKEPTGCHRYKGPYIDEISKGIIGREMVLWSIFSDPSSTFNNTSSNFDLDGDGIADTKGARNVYLAIYGASFDEFSYIDSVLDGSIGIATSNTELLGRVKYSSSEDGFIYIYITHTDQAY